MPVGGKEHVVANNLMLIFATPSPAIDDAEFNTFQYQHNGEVLDTPGFVAARRYRLRQIRGEGFPSSFRYMTVYEIDAPFEKAREELNRTAPNRYRPEWYPREVTVGNLLATSLDDRPDPSAVDHAFLTFTGTPAEMTFDEYNAWYSGHQADNIAASPLISDGWRFGLAPRPGSEIDAPSHLAIYALTGSPEEMLAEVRGAMVAAGISNPAGFHAYASFEATAIAEQRRAS
jgi:hypothetical protein